MFCQIAVRGSNRRPDNFHILLQLCHILLDATKPMNDFRHFSHILKHRIKLRVLLLHKHTKMVYISIAHTNSLARTPLLLLSLPELINIPTAKASAQDCGAVLEGYGYGGFFGSNLTGHEPCLHVWM